MATYGWLYDAKRCIECRACEAACKQWNRLEPGVQYRKVRVKEMGHWPHVRTQAISMACNHCDNPLCLRACPVKAMYRRQEDGAVIIDESKCVGCRLCERFCPYGAPSFNEKTGKMMKCTMCYDRLELGLEPACATVCPTGALQFKPWAEIANVGVAMIENFNSPQTTRPRIRFVADGWPAPGR